MGNVDGVTCDCLVVGSKVVVVTHRNIQLALVEVIVQGMLYKELIQKK